MAESKAASRSRPSHSLLLLLAARDDVASAQRLLADLSDLSIPTVVVEDGNAGGGELISQLERPKERIREVVDGQRLSPGQRYLVAANRRLEIGDGRLRLRRGRPPGSVTTALSVLTSAAREYGDDLIVVLPPHPSAQALVGIRQITERGGTTLARRAPDGAHPAALQPPIVDIVADLEQIPEIVRALVAGEGVIRRDEEAAVRALLDELRERHGIDFNAYKLPTVMRRLRRRMAAVGVNRVPEYSAFLATHPDEQRRLVSSFFIKVTEFMRDSELFDLLRKGVLPALIEYAQRNGTELRLWSAGCATGEEAYSLAMLVADVLGNDLEQFKVRIFATDIDADAIAFARRGIYPASSVADLPPALVQRHFRSLNGDYEVSPLTRSLIVFGEHDLAQRAPFPRIDLVLCRNVLIYFTPELQRRALQVFAFALRENGYLVLGNAETVSPYTEPFEAQNAQLKVFRRKPVPAPIPTSVTHARVTPASHRPRLEPGTVAIRRTTPARERSEHLILGLPLGLVLVNSRYDIEVINPVARTLLGIHTPAIGDDIVHMIEVIPAPELRALIDSALEGRRTEEIFEVAQAEDSDGASRYIRVATYPADEGADDQVVIVVDDVTSIVQQQRGAERVRDEQQAEIDRMRTRIEQLTKRNRELIEANRQVSRANAELRAGNEELTLSNEEVQAATEEVETLNEEMQATNEELETLNEELQATVEELHTTNEDLQARTEELQRLAEMHERQRLAAEQTQAQYQALFESLPDAVVVVDESGQERFANERYRSLLRDGAALVDGSGRGVDVARDLLARAASGAAFRERLEIRSRDGATGTAVQAWGRAVEFDGRRTGGLVVLRTTDETSREIPRT